MPQDIAAGSFKYTVQPEPRDVTKMNQIGARVARYHNMPENRRVFMQSGAKPSEMFRRVGPGEAKQYDTRGKARDVLLSGVGTSNASVSPGEGKGDPGQ